jgi:chromosome segregation ATPase
LDWLNNKQLPGYDNSTEQSTNHSFIIKTFRMKLQGRNYPQALLLIAGIITTGIITTSFDNGNHFGGAKQGYHQADTIPESRNKQKRNAEKETDAIERLNKQMAQLDEAMKQVGEEIKNIDFEKINKEVELSMKKIDMEKIKKEIDESMAKIDWKKMEADMAKAKVEIASLNIEEMKKEIEAALNIDMSKLKEELARIKVDIPKIDMKEIIENAQKGIETAKVELARAKEEMKAYKTMLKDMEQDGLIDTKKEFLIEYKNNELFINKVKQPANVAEKYKSYFKKGAGTIRHEGGEINLDFD